MKPIVIFKKKVTYTHKNCDIVRHYFKVVYFFGNVFFSKNPKSFTKKWYNKTSAVLHILGFRFVISYEYPKN